MCHPCPHCPRQHRRGRVLGCVLGVSPPASAPRALGGGAAPPLASGRRERLQRFVAFCWGAEPTSRTALSLSSSYPNPRAYVELPYAGPNQRSAAHGTPTHWFRLHVPCQRSKMLLDHSPGLQRLLQRVEWIVLSWGERLLLGVICGTQAVTLAAALAAPSPIAPAPIAAAAIAAAPVAAASVAAALAALAALAAALAVHRPGRRRYRQD